MNYLWYVFYSHAGFEISSNNPRPPSSSDRILGTITLYSILTGKNPGFPSSIETGAAQALPKRMARDMAASFAFMTNVELHLPRARQPTSGEKRTHHRFLLHTLKIINSGLCFGLACYTRRRHLAPIVQSHGTDMVRSQRRHASLPPSHESQTSAKLYVRRLFVQ